jgi:iron complex outermembrane receptor protein
MFSFISVKKFIPGIIILGLAVNARAQEIDLEKIVVTPSRYAQEIEETASSISVIDSADIAGSNAGTITDLLRPVPGLMVRDWYGNASKVSVDTRGFGELGALNTLVLIDGRRVNEIDQSGVDWTQVPLDQVERIEIIRGGAGGVLYGDNAVGGVINIITKKGSGAPKFELSAEIGSYDQNKERLSFSGSTQKLDYLLSGSFEGTHGYRNNSYYNATDFTSRFGYDLTSNLGLHFSSGYNKSSYGLPGPVSSSQVEQYNRRYSQYGDDHANNLDYYFDLGAETKFLPLGNFNFDLSFRRKQVITLFLTSINYPGGNPIYKNNINTLGFTPKYTLDKDFFRMKNKLVAGLDFYQSQYVSDNFSPSDVLQNYAHINKTSIGGYLQDELSPLEKFAITGGWRWEEARYTFNYHDFAAINADIDTKIIPKEQAFSAGIAYNYMEDSSLFLNINQNFRFPATDEYYSVWGTPPVNINLKPQTSKNIEFGLRHSFNRDYRFDLSFFEMDVSNELYYNPLTYANENYDKTRHQGIEASFNARLKKNIAFFGNYSFTKSTFDGGVYDKKTVPMVPRNKASLGLMFSLPQNITLNILGNFVDSRYFINDQANNFSRLSGYITADANISYTRGDFRVTGAVNNMLDRMYSEYAVCNSVTGAKNYYPSPGRNYSLKASYKF